MLVAPGAGELDPSLNGIYHRGRGDNFAEMLKFGIEFSDGRRATNVGGRGYGGDEPEGPVLWSMGGGGGGGRWHQDFWVWPLPPAGPLAFVCEWPAAGIALTRTEVDAQVLLDAAARARELFPDRASSDHPGSTWSSTTFASGRSSSRDPHKVAALAPPAGSGSMLSDRFRAAVEAGEILGASEQFRDDAVFRSPVVFRPYAGRETVLQVLGAAERVLTGSGRFRYVHQLEDSGARVAILEFATEVDGRQVEGIDKLTFGEDGRIAELTVMLRPTSALRIVAARMAEEFARLGLEPPT